MTGDTVAIAAISTARRAGLSSAAQAAAGQAAVNAFEGTRLVGNYGTSVQTAALKAAEGIKDPARAGAVAAAYVARAEAGLNSVASPAPPASTGAAPTYFDQSAQTVTQTAQAALSSSSMPTYQKALIAIALLGLGVKLISAARR